VRTFVAAAPNQAGLPLPGRALTRRAVTITTAAIVVMSFAFSLGNVTGLCLDLGITAWIGWLVAPAVDLSVIGLLTGIRFLSLHGYTDSQLARPKYMLRFCGILTLALNTAGGGVPSSRASIRCSWAGRTGGTGCGSRWKSTCW